MNSREVLASLLAGGCAGFTVDVGLFPLDTVKTRVQSQQGFYKAGGFRGIYSGVIPAAVGSFPGSAAFFVTYDFTKSLLSPRGGEASSQWAGVTHMLAAASAETMGCLWRNPTEVIKQRAQASPSSSTWHILLTTVREEGVRGLYRGYGSLISREVPFSLIQFPLWEYFKTLWSRKQGHKLHSWQSAVCGAFAGVMAGFCTTPLDMAKTRIMLAKAGTSTARGRISLVIYDVWRSQGLTGVFAGCVPRVTIIGIGGFLFLGAYEKSRPFFL
ncbi:mitochondrial S-adenosylmethionine carrier protein [Antennarius striatus]|uniref:mitochondrial S-adenosylmethionine carrier protein n=1 Tax=Antennarius striatus TaxID=241820 RepID=UPI0035B2194E